MVKFFGSLPRNRRRDELEETGGYDPRNPAMRITCRPGHFQRFGVRRLQAAGNPNRTRCLHSVSLGYQRNRKRLREISTEARFPKNHPKQQTTSRLHREERQAEGQDWKHFGGKIKSGNLKPTPVKDRKTNPVGGYPVSLAKENRGD